jgi:hypothetical protein
MQTYVFLDLDDTLFQTRPKCPPDEPLTPAALGRDGEPLSFMTQRQQALFDLLARSGTIIPTTARNLDAFRRVRLTFRSLAILDFGGVVLLPDGNLDPVWDAHVRPLAIAFVSELEQLRQTLVEFIGKHRLGVSPRIITDFGMPLYIVMKHPAGNVAVLDRVRREMLADLDTERFLVHANDNNLSVMPRFLGKEQAVRHVIEHHLGDDPVLTIGVADSLSDAAYLGLCDFAMLPRGSQLARLLNGEPPGLSRRG